MNEEDEHDEHDVNPKARRYWEGDGKTVPEWGNETEAATDETEVVVEDEKSMTPTVESASTDAAGTPPKGTKDERIQVMMSILFGEMTIIGHFDRLLMGPSE